MTRPGYVDRNKLQSWADTRPSQSEFPRLVRRLILETTPGLVELGMPAGDGVAAGDWDGSVRTTEATAWVPDGLSVWELSVNSSPNKKADEDYSKRTDTPDGTPTADCTYVEAILRPWTARATWATGKRSDPVWRDVKVLGLDDIETWLEAAPITWAWLSEELGLSPYGLRTGLTWWRGWAGQTNPALTPGVVLAGRTDTAKASKTVSLHPVPSPRSLAHRWRRYAPSSLRSPSTLTNKAKGRCSHGSHSSTTYLHGGS
jgi:hypothetical protein